MSYRNSTWQMDNPMPVPPYSLEVLLSTCEKGWKRRCCNCRGMPMPAHDILCPWLDLNTYSMLKYTLLIELQPTKVKDLCKWCQQKHKMVMTRVMLQTCTSILNRDKNGIISWKPAISRSFLGFPLPPTCHCLTTAKIPFPHTQSGRHSTSFKAKISTTR